MKVHSLPLPEAVIFDFDGIIVDTEPLHYKAFLSVLEPLGMGFPWEWAKWAAAFRSMLVDAPVR